MSAHWERQGPGQYQHTGTGAWLEDSQERRVDRWSLTVTAPHDDREAVAYFPRRSDAELFHTLLGDRAVQDLLT